MGNRMGSSPIFRIKKDFYREIIQPESLYHKAFRLLLSRQLSKYAVEYYRKDQHLLKEERGCVYEKTA